jgi:hypothetical protein
MESEEREAETSEYLNLIEAAPVNRIGRARSGFPMIFTRRTSCARSFREACGIDPVVNTDRIIGVHDRVDAQLPGHDARSSYLPGMIGTTDEWAGFDMGEAHTDSLFF